MKKTQLTAREEELLKALRTVTVNLTAAVSAYEAKAMKRDAFGRVRMRDFNHAISVGRAAIAAAMGQLP